MFFLYGLIVLFGMWGEFILLIMVVIGLFICVVSFGMIVFIVVMIYVDVIGYGVDVKMVGVFFDGDFYLIIFDDWLLWIFFFLVLILKGFGFILVDVLLGV